jgi:methyl coenzyme M reductase subunit D
MKIIISESYRFKVKIKNPLIITNKRELRDYGKNSKEVTKTLLDFGYDTLVLKHEKTITGYGKFGYIFELPYYESEVIKLKDI